HLIEDVLRHHDREFAFERYRQLDEIERIGGQIVTQGDVGDEFLDSDTKTLSDKASNMRFHGFVHVPPSQARHQLRSSCAAGRSPRYAAHIRRPTAKTEARNRTGAGARTDP